MKVVERGIYCFGGNTGFGGWLEGREEYIYFRHQFSLQLISVCDVGPRWNAGAKMNLIFSLRTNTHLDFLALARYTEPAGRVSRGSDCAGRRGDWMRWW